MTYLEALEALGGALDCLTAWDQVVDQLRIAGIAPDLVNETAVGLCLLDRRAHTLLRQLEREVIAR